ncbi:hypothetical protein G6F29_004134 [Rhizopus arrhizus]|uniref:Uncharacterized protein n=1 Tax=Rhizopus oryzae TaxID=64495 RepID=A0A9P6XGC4_RHIOR|nr:hypothetical protein G6F24_003055 [Rhizopus arrhizus]KAG0794635.1 hypothetical protein G6F21_002723 [Rhizopus arrhizus]KAG0815940.1 hypothetical protein G6F20_003603 [Rhizopus arrhizus]KAG0837273.1 hypothetical protein G6F19_003799 [Rhizopus arrhizus]KAG0857387.1 hypothetical protein G6F17_003736 [Rhizopus arrhizus]
MFNSLSTVRDYIKSAFEKCLPAKHELLRKQLNVIIDQAKRTDMIDYIDWTERDLPSACEDTKNPKATTLFHKTENKIIRRIGNIELTAEEAIKRAQRAQRFQSEPSSVTVTPPTVKKKKKHITPIVWDLDSVSDQPIIGTSTALEKPYFRLTSAADPSTVRPLGVLEQTFKLLRKKWRKEANYSYICEQFKSMRQDLTVQRIQNEFTVKVYETHARIALEKGDIGEYNQCQTQLKYLYEQGVDGCEDEFLAYRILYMLFSRNQSDLNAMMEEMCDIGLNNQAECVQHALMVRSSLAKGNYHKFFRLYENAPNMGGYLIDQFANRERIDSLIVICKAYKMSIPLSYIAKELSFDSVSRLLRFLNESGVYPVSNVLDTKTTLPILQAKKEEDIVIVKETKIIEKAVNNDENIFHPHTLTVLVVVLGLMFYAAIRSNYENTGESIRLGILAAIVCFVLIGMVHFPDGPFVRPSKPIWRAVLSLSVLYQLFLVFLLFLNKDDARQFMKYYDPGLGIVLPERSYAESCDLSWDNIKNQMDLFVVAHALGWFAKALILRDYWFCWIISVSFELCEYSLQHQLNNFAECWWDHWILDVLLCNWLGIHVGMKFCQYFSCKEYSWVGFRQIKTLRGKAKRAVQQFTPKEWTRYEWKTTSSPKNYFGTVLLLIVFLQCELNCFYLKSLLWIPPEHPLNTYRLILLFFFALPGAREVYQYVSDNSTQRLGAHAWLLIFNIMTETLICLKFSENEFHESAPIIVKIGWSIIVVFGIHLKTIKVIRLDLVLENFNIYAYYHIHDISFIQARYVHWIFSSAITILLVVFVINEERDSPIDPIVTESGRILSGEKWASLYSKIMFSWVNVMMKKGNLTTLNEQDLLELPPENCTKNVLQFYRLQGKSKMAWNLLSAFKGPLFIQFFYCIGWSILMFGPPYFLNNIIKYIEHGEEPASSAYLYVLGLLLTSSIQSLCYQQALYIGRTLGIRIQSIVIGEVYSKSLRRRDESGVEKTEENKSKGNVNNLLSVDSQKMGELTAYIFYIYCFPIQIAICIWSLYKLLGTSSLYGVVIMILSQPLTYYLSRRFQKLHHNVMAFTDKRIRIMNELLSAIRIVKFFAWEEQLRSRVVDARDEELKAIRSRLYSFMYIGNAWFLIPIMIMVTVFYMYTRENILTASTAFTALALFNNFKTTMDEFPLITSFILQANVSLGRIEKFLKEDEVQSKSANSSDLIGFVDNASFSWDHNCSTTHIRDLNVTFPRNKLSVICGPTGSGKTTLLASLLGETYCVSGAALLPRKQSSTLGGAVSGVAYVAQTAWLQNCSIRDNILFGLPYDDERYQKILYMTALTRDLEILEFGDQTEVGERGITLSGGQKQRVAIARAVYSQADIVILDDCLSAVDAHTAKHLYEHCLKGEYMKYRTVLLVTHHVALCIRGAGYVVVLNESGLVTAQGKPLDVIKSGLLGDELTEEVFMSAREEEAVDGPIPKVPHKIISKINKPGAGKLVHDEKRAEGSVKWSVYGTYYYASGGMIFWISVILLFCLAQGAVLGQDYWIKIWSAAYDNVTNLLQTFLLVPIDAFEKKINIGYYLSIYFLIGILALVLTITRSLVLFNGSLNASRRIHMQLLDRLLGAKVRFFDTTPVGRIVNRFSSDLETIDQNVASSLSFLLYSVIATISVILLVSVITPAFILPGICIAYLFKVIGLYYLNASRDLKRLNSVSRSPVYIQFNETINGVATIRAFGAQTRFVHENWKRIDANNRPFIWMWATNRWLHCRVDVLGAFVGFCTGIVLVLSRDWIQPGLAGLSLSYALTFTHHVLWVVRMYALNEMNMNAIERVHEYLDIDQEPKTAEIVPSPSWPESGLVEVENLVMKYSPESPAVLHNVSFKTRPREKIGIVGRTGSGKSTLALSLFRFMEPVEGRILIDGHDIHKLALNELRSRLTIIPQDPVLFSGTLRSNLDPFNQYDDSILWAALRRAHLIDHANTEETIINLDSPVMENGSNWSQGQRQLIALARALVKRTSLILLDEATSSVDFDTDHKIQETIRNEFKDSTLLCIAHRIRTVADYDRILVLDHGQVMEFDTPYNLMTKEGSIFQQMCLRSGEYQELLAIAQQKH